MQDTLLTLDTIPATFTASGCMAQSCFLIPQDVCLLQGVSEPCLHALCFSHGLNVLQGFMCLKLGSQCVDADKGHGAYCKEALEVFFPEETVLFSKSSPPLYHLPPHLWLPVWPWDLFHSHMLLLRCHPAQYTVD